MELHAKRAGNREKTSTTLINVRKSYQTAEWQGEWPSCFNCLLTAEVKLGRVRSTSGWVTSVVLSKQLTPLSFAGDAKLGHLPVSNFNCG